MIMRFMSIPQIIQITKIKNGGITLKKESKNHIGLGKETKVQISIEDEIRVSSSGEGELFELEKGKKLGIRRVLTVGMLICERFFKYQIPQKFKRNITKKDQSISQRIEEHLLSNNKEIIKQFFNKNYSPSTH